MKNILKTICLVVLVINLIGCSSVSTTASSPGGTSIEVASIIRGTVVRSDQTPAENAIVEILPVYTTVDKDSEIPRDSIETDSDGWFNKEVNFTGALSVVIRDNSGNGAFKPCTLVTKDTIIDLDTVVLEELAKVTFELDYSEIEHLSYNNFQNSYLWCKERGEMFEPDTNGVIVWDSIPSGEYNIRISPMWVSKLSKVEVFDTTIIFGAGDTTTVAIELNEAVYDSLSENLRDEIDIVYKLREFNHSRPSDAELQKYVDTLSGKKVPFECAITDDHVVQLVFTDDVDTFHNTLGDLEYLEWFYIMMGGENVTALPESIGNLKRLTRFSLRNCSNLTTLPESFGDIKTIEMLEITGDHGFTELPEAIYSLGMISYCTIDFKWIPSAREEQWALDVMFKGDTIAFDGWLADLYVQYGDQVE